MPVNVGKVFLMESAYIMIHSRHFLKVSVDMCSKILMESFKKQRSNMDMREMYILNNQCSIIYPSIYMTTARNEVKHVFLFRYNNGYYPTHNTVL